MLEIIHFVFIMFHLYNAMQYSPFSLVRLHLLPLNSSLVFSPNRFLPDPILQLMTTKLAAFPESIRLLKQTELNVKTLHCLSDPGQLYQQTSPDYEPPLSSSTTTSTSASSSSSTTTSSAVPRLAERHSNWEPRLVREASVSHEYWTFHGHDFNLIHQIGNQAFISCALGAAATQPLCS